jgi:SAM-dependent methyltransferase
MTHPERIIPDETAPGILALHLKRYVFARPYVQDKDVLDAACGVGYGTAYLAEPASRVVGVDIDAGTLSYAQHRYGAPNVEFLQMDVTELDMPAASFDVVVSFETLEHVRDAPAAVGEAARVLREGGIYIVSTPRVTETTSNPENPFHATEYSPEDFADLLAGSFADVELYGQRRLETRRHGMLRRLDIFGLRRHIGLSRAAILTGSPPTTNLTLDDIAIERDAVDEASELVAVCRNPY